MTIEHEATLPGGVSVTFRYDGTVIRCEWQYGVPEFKSNRKRRAFLRQYQQARDAFLRTIATAINGHVMSIDLDRQGIAAKSIKPETRQ